MAVPVEGFSEPMYVAPADIVSVSHCPSLQQYRRMYVESVDEPDKFWRKIAEQFHWQRWHTGPMCEYNFDARRGRVYVQWMQGAVTNMCYNALDRHVNNGLADRVAFHWEGNEPADSSVITYGQMLSQVQRCANMLRAQGLAAGDRAAIYMPMIPELAVCVLACARLGIVHSIVFGGFSADSLAERIQDAQCRVVVTADGVWRATKLIKLKQITDKAVSLCNEKGFTVERVITVQHLSRLAQHSSLNTTDLCDPADCQAGWNADRDLWWHEAMAVASDQCDVEWLDAEHPLFLLYTSGSTGKPKGILHTIGGYMMYAATTFKYTFDHQPGSDVYWCTADVGWITGHSYVVYGPMLNAAVSVMFEGTPFHPSGSRMWEIVDKYSVSKFYTAPTAIRALMRLGDEPVKQTSRASLRVLGSVGEPINPEAWLWYWRVVGGAGRCVVVDTFWQTETGGHVITPLPAATPTKPGAAGTPFFGVVPLLLDEQGTVIEGEGEGYLVFDRPWPGLMRSVYNDHERYQSTYFGKFPGYYCTGDGARRDADGYIWLTGRIDDMLNVSGHLLSTAQIESALVEHSSVAEAAVVAVPHPVKGEAVYAYVTTTASATWTDKLRAELIVQVRQRIGALAAPDFMQYAPALPKTRSGKIMRRVLRDTAAGRPPSGDTSTMADQTVLQQLLQHRCPLPHS